MYTMLKMNPLFADISEEQQKTLLSCLKAVTRSYCKDEFIFRSGDQASMVGIVLSGGARVLMEDAEGQRIILTHVAPGELFGEAFSCAKLSALPVSIVASAASEIVLIEYRKIVTTCTSACIFHTTMVMNMLKILAEENIFLTRKIENISKKTMREKVLSFLSTQPLTHNGTIEIPFNRQELSEYLCVDRSALSRELSAMQAEGLIRCNKNTFELTSLT